MQGIRQKIEQISQDASLEQDQCLVLFVMSHGALKVIDGKHKDCIFGSDGKFVTPEHILNPLTDRQCAHLRGKPRLVFFQACRGGDLFIAASRIFFSSSDAPMHRSYNFKNLRSVSVDYLSLLLLELQLAATAMDKQLWERDVFNCYFSNQVYFNYQITRGPQFVAKICAFLGEKSFK